MRLVLVPSALIALALALPAGTGAATAETCDTIYAYHAVERALEVVPGLTVRLRNPYGPRVQISGFFVSFSVRYASAADRAKVTAVRWTLDGKTVSYKRGGRDQFLVQARHFTPGPHVIGVALTPIGVGAEAHGEFRFTATTCGPAFFSGSADNSRPVGAQPAGFNVQSGDPELRHLVLGSAGGVRVSTAARLRGRVVGALRFGSGGGPLALRLPRTIPASGAISLLRRGALRVTLHPLLAASSTSPGCPRTAMTSTSASAARQQSASSPATAFPPPRTEPALPG